jgi:hypothetical protein
MLTVRIVDKMALTKIAKVACEDSARGRCARFLQRASEIGAVDQAFVWPAGAAARHERQDDRPDLPSRTGKTRRRPCGQALSGSLSDALCVGAGCHDHEARNVRREAFRQQFLLGDGPPGLNRRAPDRTIGRFLENVGMEGFDQRVIPGLLAIRGITDRGQMLLGVADRGGGGDVAGFA